MVPKLRIDKAVHTQSDHHKYISQKINRHIVIRIANGSVAGSKQI